MTSAYIIGIDMLKFGRFPDKTVVDLGADAALGALDDAGLAITDMQACYVGNLMQANAMVGQQIMREIGQTGIPVVNTANACATGATAFREAYVAVAGGFYDLALVIGVEQLGKGGMLGGPGRADGFVEEGTFGSLTNPAMFATIGMEHSRQYGTTFEQFAQVAVKNHRHSTLNPKAMYQRETPLQEVMNSEMISYPNTKLMCSVNVDGAAAAVLASEKAMDRLGLRARSVRVRASALTSNPYTDSEYAISDFNAVTRSAADLAYEQAGIGPEDLDLVELHDCFATAEVVHYENLRLCGPGEASRLIDDGDTALGGRIPVNTSGGLLSKGHPLGATGVANLYEVTTQLRGAAGDRQVNGARIGMTHVCGGGMGTGSACGVHILEKC